MTTDTTIENKKCGIIMPIAAMPGYTADHWQEVKSIIIESTNQVDGHSFDTEIVSNSDGEIDVIHKRIIQNLYNADIVICDISGKNPNVLFELGMRLTFDKPTVLIKDDQTDFMFDTGVIEHITYPKDLRFNQIVVFKEELAKRIKLTYEKSISDPEYSTFLRNFGTFKVAQLDQDSVSTVEQVVLDELQNIRNELTIVKREISATKVRKNKINIKVPANLKSGIYDYLSKDDFNPFHTPDQIATSKDFHAFMDSHDIDFLSIPSGILVKNISEVQQDKLPF